MPSQPSQRAGRGYRSGSLSPSPASRRSGSKSARGARDAGERGLTARVSKAKMCVCSASSQLGRERSRLMKVEQIIIQRFQGILDREQALAGLDEKIRRREENLCEQAEEHRSQEQEFSQRIDGIAGTVNQAEDEKRRAEECESNCEARQCELQKQEQRMQKRLDRISSKQRTLAEDWDDISSLRRELEDVTRALRYSRESAAAKENDIKEKRLELEGLELDFGARHSLVKLRQEELEPIQGELQAKEADLNERQSLLDRRRADLEEREARLERARLEIASANVRSIELQQNNDEAERRLAFLWDDIHQRQQVLGDLERTWHGREAQRIDAEHSLVVRRAQDFSLQPDVDDVDMQLILGESRHSPRLEDSDRDLWAAFSYVNS